MIPNPYLIALKVIVGLLVLALPVFGGCRWQASIDAGKIVDANERTAKAAASLRTASQALSAASARFREISAATDQAVKDAETRKELAVKAEVEAKQGQQTLRARIADLQKQADRDRKVCSAEEARICGSVLH